MTQKKQQITIILPESVADMPVRIVRGKEQREIIVDISPKEEDKIRVENEKPKYALVWEYDKHRKVALDELEWIEADESYCVLHLSGGSSMTLSCSLAVVGRELPPDDFIRIHRSYIVNLRAVTGKMGNCLQVGGKWLPIGRSCREEVFARFLFLQVKYKNAPDGQTKKKVSQMECRIRTLYILTGFHGETDKRPYQGPLRVYRRALPQRPGISLRAA